MGRDSWDPSQQIQGLKCPSQPNPNKNNIETCSVKLPQSAPLSALLWSIYGHLSTLSSGVLHPCYAQH